MRTNKTRIIGFCAILLFFVLFRAGPVRAQSLSLSIWPPLLEVTIQPGKSVTQVYKLTNNSDHDLQITPVIYPFEPKNDKGEIKISYQLPVTSYQLPKFFSFDTGQKFNEPFFLKIGETKDMVFRVSVPRNNPEKDYYYTLLFSTSIDSALASAEKDQTSSVTQIGSNILLTVSLTGQPPVLGRILKFSTPLIVDSFSPVDFEVVLENWGRSFWKPFGKIKIEGILKQKDEIPLLEQNILANSSRRLTTNSYKPKLPLGPFKAKIEFTLNEKSSAAEQQELWTTTVFWYLPYKLFLGIIVTAAIILILKRIKKSNKKTQSAP